jgi:hypothetical protein
MTAWRASSVLAILLNISLGCSVALEQSMRVSKRTAEAVRKGMIYLTKDQILEGAKKEGKVVAALGHDESRLL